jgi:MoxR-like ATPase
MIMTDAAQQQMDNDDTRALVRRFVEATGKIREQVRGTIVGQDDVVDNLLITLLVGGHCLITGMPGTAKTLLVHTLATALGLTFKRIQFTPDLMPTDITGTDMVEEDQSSGKREWRFIPGPVFTNVLLADEINRTPPKRRPPCWKPCRKKP